MDIFNNREIAMLVWFGALAVYVASNREVRESFLEVLVAFSNWKVWSPTLLLITYIAVGVYLLSIPDIWGVAQLKNTIVWTATVAVVSMVRVMTSGEKPHLLRKWITDNLKITIVFEFIIAVPTFSLLGELFFVPTMAVLVMLQAVSAAREEFKTVERLMNGILSVVGLSLIGYALHDIYNNWDAFATASTARDFLMPPLLSLLVIPILFVLYAVVSYENALIRISFAIEGKKLQSYAFRRALIEFRHHINLLKRWTRNISVSHPTDNAAIRQSISEVKNLWKKERNPPAVSPEHGWSPYVAAEFLKTVGIEMGDYHSIIGDWYASSPYLELGEGIMPDNIAYYIDGNENAATQLKLVLNVNNPDAPETSEQKFSETGIILVEKAIPGIDGEAVFSHLSGDAPPLIHSDKKISLLHEKWAGGLIGGYSRKLVVEHIGNG